jgi:hypothetical protein
VFDLFERATAAFKSQVVSQVNATHAACANALFDLIAATQDLASFERDGHSVLQYWACRK